MTDTRYVPARLRKPKPLKRTPLKRIGRLGKQRADGMKAARKFYIAKFGNKETGEAPCQLCRRDCIFDLHHKLKRSQGGDESNENLVALCRIHHTWVHSSRPIYEAVKELGANIDNGLGLKVNWSVSNA